MVVEKQNDSSVQATTAQSDASLSSKATPKEASREVKESKSQKSKEEVPRQGKLLISLDVSG